MRPKIICHMVSSVDGRLLVGRWTPPAAGIGAGLLHRHYEEVVGRLGGEGWIVGRTTMAEIAEGRPRTLASVPGGLRGTHVADRRDRDLAVAIDPHGKVHYGRDDVGGDHIVAVLGEDVPDAYLAGLREDGVSYLFAGPDGRDLASALDAPTSGRTEPRRREKPRFLRRCARVPCGWCASARASPSRTGLEFSRLAPRSVVRARR